MSQTPIKQSAPVGYGTADPSEPMPIWLRQQMRADACGHCGARVLLNAAGFREFKKELAARGIGIKILCPKCSKQAESELPPGPKMVVVPPPTDCQDN